MKRLVVAVGLLALGGGWAARAADAPPADPAARYQALLAQAKAGPAPADWQALRFAFADTPDFDAVDRGLTPARGKMLQARRADDFPTVLAQAKLVLDKDYVDGLGHLMAAVSYRELKQEPDAQREEAIAIAIFKSMQTGDGLTPATAFTVISVGEEYALMYARERRVTAQRLINQDGHVYDLLDTVGAKGDAAAFYFQIDRIWARETKMFGGAKPK
jgi:hypothetical protein